MSHKSIYRSQYYFIILLLLFNFKLTDYGITTDYDLLPFLYMPQK